MISHFFFTHVQISEPATERFISKKKHIFTELNEVNRG